VSLSPAERARYQRHLALPEVGLDGQNKLRSARVLVIGAGGLGSPSALYLAASGVGTLGVVDCDRVDVTNLQRQILFATDGIGRLKAEAARERMVALNPEITVIAHTVELRAANVLSILSSYDIVLDGTDRIATRYLVNDACVMLGRALISAAIHRFEGQAMTYVPGRGPCYRCLFGEPDSDGAAPNCAEAGVLGVLPGVLGTIQATEAIKLITGAGEPLIGRLLTYDALEMRFHEFRFERREDCPVCGTHPTIKELRDPPELCSADDLRDVRRLSPRELQTMTSVANAQILQLIDVREPHEFSVSHLPSAINIPLGQLDARLDGISATDTVVFMCRSGGRSLRACALACRAGIHSPANLEGGLLAWATDIDPSFPVAPAG
jgi:molybdopterin/thiamine biosynthesis adenylyltransferase/rhodanese-related sulfurtransferase